MEDYLLHYGIKRKSGRYPWGSGENPYQSEGWFLNRYLKMRESGMSEVDMANEFDMTTTELS